MTASSLFNSTYNSLYTFLRSSIFVVAKPFSYNALTFGLSYPLISPLTNGSIPSRQVGQHRCREGGQIIILAFYFGDHGIKVRKNFRLQIHAYHLVIFCRKRTQGICLRTLGGQQVNGQLLANLLHPAAFLPFPGHSYTG